MKDIMKKAILTFGLFSLVVLTSFTTTETKTQNIVAETGDTGDTGVGGASDRLGSGSSAGNKKLDGIVKNEEISNSASNYQNSSSFSIEARKKLDI